jgi:hypothetical protein
MNMFVSQPTYKPVEAVWPATDSEVNRLLTAAVVNQRFRQLLLTRPQVALESGFQGERFSLKSEQKRIILSSRASSLADLACKLAECAAT